VTLTTAAGLGEAEAPPWAEALVPFLPSLPVPLSVSLPPHAVATSIIVATARARMVGLAPGVVRIGFKCLSPHTHANSWVR
jgi:hypothetical protein